MYLRSRQEPFTLKKEEDELVRAYISITPLGPRKGIGILKRQWAQLSDEYGEDFIVRLVEALARNGSEWASRLAVAAKGHHLGTASLLPKVRESIISGASRRRFPPDVSPYDVVASTRRPFKAISLAFEDRDLSVKQLDETIARLSAAGRGPFDVRLAFRGESLHVHGLALVAAWYMARGVTCQCSTASPRARAYLDRIGFIKHIVSGEPIESDQFDAENFVSLTPISPSKTNAADGIAERITDLFCFHGALSETNKGPFLLTIAEMVENVFRHSESVYPAYVLAQAHPTTRKFLLAIADTGIGIHQSFRQSDNEEAKRHSRTEKEAVAAAVMPMITSKKEGHAGYGLYVVQKLTEFNGGVFRLSSGHCSYLYSPERERITRDRIVRHDSWCGTFVGLTLNMDETLDLRRVYDTLPPPRGYESQDFFE
jgi:hypothetical protein